MRSSLAFQGHMRLHKVVLDSLAFRDLGAEGLPSPLNLDPFSERPVSPLHPVVGVGLADSHFGDVLGPFGPEGDFDSVL